MNISQYIPGFNYFFGTSINNNSEEEGAPFIDIELGHHKDESTTPISPKKHNLPGSINILAKDILAEGRSQLKDPPQAPGTAAGESMYFMPRQRFLLDEKYHDRNDRTMRIIGNTIYDNLIKAEPSKGISSVIDLTTATNVGILSTTEETLSSKIDLTNTKMGKGYLRLMLARPLSNPEDLQARQNLVKTLVVNPSLLKTLKNHLTDMGRTETLWLSCYDSEKQVPGSVASLYYRLHPRISSVLNNSPFALDLSFIGTTVKKVINTAVQGISGAALAAFAATETARAFSGAETPEWLADYADRFIGSTPAGPMGSIALEINNPLINASTAAATSALCLMSLQNTYGWMKVDTAMLPFMRDILSSVATHYKSMKKVYNLLKDKPEITQGLEHFSKLENFLTNKEKIKELDTLFGLLDSFTFNENNHYMFRPGEVLLAWELLHSSSVEKKKKDKSSESDSRQTPRPPAAGDKIREAAAKIIPAIGEIDAFLSTAQLMLNSQNDTTNQAKYCFPTFITNSSKPHLHIQGLWNPRISQDKAVPNDISLGGDSSQGMLITGPNTGGKSCLGLGIMAAATLAQSLGIAPGTSMITSLFNYMRTSMEVRGSIEEEQSLFAAQSKSIGDIQKGINDLPGFSLTVLDEPLSGTKAQAGELLVLNVAKSLTETGNNLSVIVTHLEEVAKSLEGSSYTNYQMKDDGSYRLEEGIYEGSNAIEIAKANGILSTDL